jgi:ABC-type branched-subunit amino acid transport system ATPase component/branched-subunit amino acid ABC-type transport system permease component
MPFFVQIGILGLGAGAVYGILALGLVVIYRGSGLINFAQGALAMAAGYLFYQLATLWHIPAGFAIVMVVAVFAALGFVIQLAIMRTMRRSAPLARVMVTLGILLTLESLVTLKYGSNSITIGSFYPSGAVDIFGAHLGDDRLIILGVGVGVALLLSFVYGRSQFGRLTEAVSQNPQIAASLGYSPDLVASANWAIGCGLAGLAGCLYVPLVGLDVSTVTLLVIPALSAMVIGNFRSFPLILLAGLGIGILQAEATNYISSPGWGDVLPLVAIMAVFLIRGTALPLRDYLTERLPTVVPGTVRRRYLAITLVVLLVVIVFANAAWTQALTVTVLAAIVGLSVVLITGYAGQLSLAPYTFAGVGALAAAHLASSAHLSLIPALLFGCLIAVGSSVIIALPALRARGLQLAVVTLSFATALQSVLFLSISWAGGQFGLTYPSPSIFGWSMNELDHPKRYAIVVAVGFVLMCALVLNVRRGVAGRRMIAIRDNERAAASLGVSVRNIKLYAFALSAVIAAVGGILAEFATGTATFTTGFDPLSSILIVEFVVFGGIGFASGAGVGSLLVAGGLISQILSHWESAGQYLQLAGGILVIIQLTQFPDGAIPGQLAILKRLAPLLQRVRPTPRPPKVLPGTHKAANMPSGAAQRVESRRLTVSDLSVTFGGHHAVSNVNLSVGAGEVLGLIGPNGAGKTTTIDAISGFVASKGSIALDEQLISRSRTHQRAALGLVRSFQSIELFDDLSVIENLAVGGEGYGPRTALGDLVVPQRPRLSNAGRAAVAEFGLGDVVNLSPGELSFGRRRLVGIARAVACNPSILLLDEPGAGLDTAEIHELGRLVRRLADNWGMGVLLVEHHLDFVTAVCDRVVVLDQGREIAAGPPQEIIHDPRVRRAYIGDEDTITHSTTENVS